MFVFLFLYTNLYVFVSESTNKIAVKIYVVNTYKNNQYNNYDINVYFLNVEIIKISTVIKFSRIKMSC